MNLSTLSKQQMHMIEETYSKMKSGVITATMFMQMLEVKKNMFHTNNDGI